MPDIRMQTTSLANSINRTKYIEKFLNKFNITEANSNSVPDDLHVKLTKTEGLSERKHRYREAVGSFIHAVSLILLLDDTVTIAFYGLRDTTWSAPAADNENSWRHQTTPRIFPSI
ncbi:hypothetical protein EVAR_38310_1 [Eumeta japonica]|uniref:Uncharacterized protein n=1 Tax=Eumeta variegata TaxID=151549 RepID=A0A4C1W764_EUMVA|nr:hypothetical protein EVAR_38310_1 [Eumeta japonica]